MRKSLKDTRYMATLAMLCGVLLVMGMTGIGFIPLPVIKATTMHIPVILGAILLGPEAGAVLGGLFGLCSIWANTITPGVLSFAFSPFMTTEGFVGMLKAVWIAFGCRTLFGYLSGWIWRVVSKLCKSNYFSMGITAAVSSILHTVLVMGSIYVLLAQQYAQAKNVGFSAVFGLVMGTVTASGIPEAIAAAVLVAVIGRSLQKLLLRLKKR